MSRISISATNKVQKVADALYLDLDRRITAAPHGNCPVDLSIAFVRLCQAQSCGKCVPCRIGLKQLSLLMENILDGKATLAELNAVKETAKAISDSADCAIGTEAANMVLTSITAFYDDYNSHIKNGCCTTKFQAVPCVSLCPANVDVPGYIALTGQQRYSDAVALIRKDNPFPSVCALICEHPCESHCRRNTVDDSINIRGIKRFAIDNAGEVKVPKSCESTGKTVAVIGGGPSGLTAAYYLSLMGHKVTVFERRKKLGGMLRYGIPVYRLPDSYLDYDINAVLSTGVVVKTGIDIGKDITFSDLRNQYDTVYISIGAHSDKKLGIEGEELNGVISAVDLLREIGDGKRIDFSEKKVVVIGGGNVAMDVSRTAIRLGAKSVKCIYRRRKNDMTALPDEIEGTIAEGCEIVPLMVPTKIEDDGNGNISALIVQPQIIGKYDRGRPKPYNSDKPLERIECDILIVAIGQEIESKHFADFGIPVKWNMLTAKSTGEISDFDGLFAGGDCVFGPSTVIKAIKAGKVAAGNIDNYLGYNHEISADIHIPDAPYKSNSACGRINMTEREAEERKYDFMLMEKPMSLQEVNQECSRCLRCDHYGYGSFRGGRVDKW